MNLNIKTVVRNQKFLGCAALAAAVLCSASLRAADAGLSYRSIPGSEIRIDGDSTAHKWYMLGSMIGGSLQLPAGTVIDVTKDSIPGVVNGKLDAKVQAIVAVRSVHSVEKVMPNVMDGLYQDALKEKTNPKITYTLTEMTFKTNSGKAFQFDTKGELAIAGVTNTVTMPVTIETTNTTNLQIVGSASFKMTDFKITPPAPSFGLGLMKVADPVTVSFKWLLKPEAPAAAPAATK